MIKKSFYVYIPEAHGFQTGSNNGNYRIAYEFLEEEENGKFYFRESSSSDGDMTPWPSWEEVDRATYQAIMEEAKKEQEREYRLLDYQRSLRD